MIPHKQLTLAEIFQDCQEFLESDRPKFLSLLENHIDLDSIIPISFRNHFYASTGRTRKYPLNAMLWALIIQRIFSIPTDSLLLVFLQYSKALRDFCGFTKVPDASKITRFKQDFLSDLQSVFENLVDLTEPICQAIASDRANMTIFDTSGIEAWVTENNPKYANKVIKQLKAYAKANHFDSNSSGFFQSSSYDKSQNLSWRCSFRFCSHLRETAKSKAGLTRFKFVCPKTKWIYDSVTKKAHRECQCDSPCTKSKCGRMIYIQQQSDLRAYPGTLRGTNDWDNTYKIRTTVERSINHFKDSFGLAGRKTQNEKTLHADLILAGITQLISVILADKIHQHQYIRSLKPLIA